MGKTQPHSQIALALGIILFQWVYNDKHPYCALPGGKLTRIKALTTLDVPINLDSLSDPLLYDTIRLCLEKRIEIKSQCATITQTSLFESCHYVKTCHIFCHKCHNFRL